jgi:hypothetical protein
MLDAFVAADNGDYSGLALMCFFFDHMIASGVNWGDNIAKAMSADFDPSRDYKPEMMPKDAVIGSPFSRIVGFMQQRDWPIEFNPSDTLPKQAKKYLMIAVGAGTGILLLLVGASRFAWRRYRRRRTAKSTSGVVVTEKLPVGA